MDNEVARAAAERYLFGLPDERIDTLVLGCTHYPLLEGVIQKAVGPAVQLIDSAYATATVVRARLEERGLLLPVDGGAGDEGAAEDQFFVTDSSERFHEVGSRFLGGPLSRLEQVDLQD